jgi:PAS domain S-box-containing protein
MKNLYRVSSDVRGCADRFPKKNARVLDKMNRRKETDGINALLAAAVELSKEAVVLTNSRGFIQYVNSAFEHITGYPRGEVIGRSPHLLDSGRHDEAFYRNMREILSREGVWRGQLISRKKDGTLYPEDCTVALVRSPSSEATSYISIRRDIMDMLRLESIAEKVDAEKNCGFIFTGVRHEIGNLINSLLMLLSVLRSKLEKLDKPTVGKYLDRALEQVSKGSYLLRSLKNSNMYEKPELQKMNLSTFMDRFIELIKEDFITKEIAVTATIEAGAEHCFADPRNLHQILLNLLVNASDALEGRECRQVTLTAFEEENSVIIRVKDNGCGMTEEQLQNLFKPFYTTKEKGTGLGLVIVKKLLAAMNGSIKISSLKGIGTTIDIMVPRQKIEVAHDAKNVMVNV